MLQHYQILQITAYLFYQVKRNASDLTKIGYKIRLVQCSNSISAIMQEPHIIIKFSEQSSKLVYYKKHSQIK